MNNLKTSGPQTLFWLILSLVCFLPVRPLSGDDPTSEETSQKTSSTNHAVSEITPKSRASVKKALNWLVEKAQNRDGSWGENPGEPGDLSITATACLALMARGNTPNLGPHSDALKHGLEYIMKHTEHVRSVFNPSRSSTMQQKLGGFINTYMTTLFFGQVSGVFHSRYANETNDIHRRLKLIVGQEEKILKNGGWTKNTWSIGLTTASAWLSLRSAYQAGVEVKSSLNKVLKQMKKTSSDFTNRTESDDPKGFYNAAAVIRIFYGMGKKDEPIARRATKHLLNMVDTGKFGRYSFEKGSVGGEEYYAALLATQGLFHGDRKTWKTWYPFIRKTLISLQLDDGSWNGHHCITSNTFCTAVNIMTLSIPNRLLPMYQQ